MTTRLHLGCGRRFMPGYYHVDAHAFPHVDHVGLVDDLSFIETGMVERIYACHVLEHFGRNEVHRVLGEWARVLKPGGTLRLAVPDFAACVEIYCQGHLRALVGILGLVCGGQRDEYDFHKMVFDQHSLTELLAETGFDNAKRWDWRTTEHANIDDYSQAYLPHMDKEFGRLMSLNLEATRRP